MKTQPLTKFARVKDEIIADPVQLEQAVVSMSVDRYQELFKILGELVNCGMSFEPEINPPALVDETTDHVKDLTALIEDAVENHMTQPE